MEQRSAKPFSVADLAMAVNLGPSHLSRLFRKSTGRSPSRYDKDRRLDRARELLLRTCLSVKEVMGLVGWNDPSHFGREFKRRFGVGPLELRDTPRVERAGADQHPEQTAIQEVQTDCRQ